MHDVHAIAWVGKSAWLISLSVCIVYRQAIIGAVIGNSCLISSAGTRIYSTEWSFRMGPPPVPRSRMP